MARDFIIDFETMGLRDNSVILSVGILPVLENNERYESFKDLMSKGLYIKFDREQQFSFGRTFDKDTLEWWKTQPAEVMEALSKDNCTEAYKAYTDIMMFLKKWGFSKDSFIWSRGLLDQRWWSTFVEDVKKINPNAIDFFPYYNWRDIRTALSILTGDVKGNVMEPQDFIQHNPLCDCCMDFLRLKEAFK